MADQAIGGDIRTPAPWQLVDLFEQSRRCERDGDLRWKAERDRSSSTATTSYGSETSARRRTRVAARCGSNRARKLIDEVSVTIEDAAGLPLLAAANICPRAARASVGNRSEPSRSGTASMPDRETRPKRARSPHPVPSHVPIHTQTAANAAPFAYGARN